MVLKNQKIKITKNGPFFVSGNLPLDKQIIETDENGDPIKWGKGESYEQQENWRLCRCGQSKNKPFCDNSHLNVGFDGTETASHERYLEQSKKITGPELDLTDAPKLCASAYFCHRAGGTWMLTENPNEPESKKIAIQQAGDCPSGRLVTCDKKTNQPFEPQFEPSLSIVEDPGNKVSGPIWVKGGVPMESSDGTQYETRNRVTLCRCGKSSNKPFCDGTHIDVGFNDGDESLK